MRRRGRREQKLTVKAKKGWRAFSGEPLGCLRYSTWSNKSPHTQGSRMVLPTIVHCPVPAQSLGIGKSLKAVTRTIMHVNLCLCAVRPLLSLECDLTNWQGRRLSRSLTQKILRPPTVITVSTEWLFQSWLNKKRLIFRALMEVYERA